MKAKTYLLTAFIILLTACSSNNEQTKTDTEQTNKETTTTEVTNNTTSAPAEQATPTTNPAPATEVKAENAKETATPEKAEQTDTADKNKEKLKAEIRALIKTLDTIDQQAQAKQVELSEKMKNADPTQQQEIFKEVVKMQQEQEKMLQDVKLSDERLVKIRDKFYEAMNLQKEITQTMVNTKEMSPETDKQLAEKMKQAQATGETAQKDLLALLKEAGLQ